jgi:hypothetical protein
MNWELVFLIWSKVATSGLIAEGIEQKNHVKIWC